MIIKNFKAVEAGALKGSFDIEFPEWDLTIRRAKVFSKNNSSWIGWPAEMYLEDDKKMYFPLVVFGQKTGKQRQAEVLELLKMPTSDNSQKTKNDWNDLAQGSIPF